MTINRQMVEALKTGTLPNGSLDTVVALANFWLECDGLHTTAPGIISRLRDIEREIIPQVSERDPMAQRPRILYALERRIEDLADLVRRIDETQTDLKQGLHRLTLEFAGQQKALTNLQFKRRKPSKRRK